MGLGGVAVATKILGSVLAVGSAVSKRKQAKEAGKNQSQLLKDQKKVQRAEKKRLNEEAIEQKRAAGSRTSALAGRLRRGQGITLFGSQTGVTTTKQGGGT